MIKNKITECNTNYYKKAYQLRVYRDKIYKAIAKDETRNRILDGILKVSDCNNKEVYKFLLRLKLLVGKEIKVEFQPISEEELTYTVWKTKREVNLQFSYTKTTQYINVH